MRRVLILFATAALIACLFDSPARAAFGLTNLDVRFEAEDGSPALLAGAHPYAVTFDLDAETEVRDSGQIVPAGAVKTIEIEQPSGFAGNPSAVETCTARVFLASASSPTAPKCPNETVLGQTTVEVGAASEKFSRILPVYNMDPPPGAILKLGFIVQGIPVTAEVRLSKVYPFNPLVRVSNVSQVAEFYSSSTTVWGNPADQSHDAQRGTCLESPGPDDCPVPQLQGTPFITLPRSCTGPLISYFKATSWEDPSTWVHAPPVVSHDHSEPPRPEGLSGCEELSFEPVASAQPTTKHAGSSSGLMFKLHMDQTGILAPDARAQSDVKKVVVTLPAGVTANPSVAAGLDGCTRADFARESVGSAPGAGCPQASKVGIVEAESPLLENAQLRGEIFVAEPYANPFGELLALYLVVREPELGIFVGLPGKVEADPVTGQLTSTFGEAPYEIPQFPLSQLRVRLDAGERGPLVTPASCGGYEISAQLTPWANPSVAATQDSTFQLDSGPAGSGCPPAPLPFHPNVIAGSTDNTAGGHSPFSIGISREDGQQDVTRFSIGLPPGVTARLTDVGRCPETAILAARIRSGRAELATPSCPPNSKIGGVTAGAGVGPQLTYVHGSLFMAGPWEGAPLSAVAIVPAVAGPFDLGTVVVRHALRVNARSGEVLVDGSRGDAIPRILDGISLHVRDLRATIDRPRFMLNPTSCNPLDISSQISGGSGLLAVPTNVQFGISTPYQAANCAALGFAPRLNLRLKGGTRRGAFPALRAVLRPRQGDTNIARTVVTLPHSAFLEQSHIRKVCTRARFAAGNCPPGSIYGYARAFTPILPHPVEGPVYLRSNPSDTLPNLVMALKGPPDIPVEVEIVGRIDSKNGGIRTTFEGTPDVPVEKLVLRMRGRKKSLITNSRNLCTHPARASVSMRGHSGKPLRYRPIVKPVDCTKRTKRDHRESKMSNARPQGAVRSSE